MLLVTPATSAEPPPDLRLVALFGAIIHNDLRSVRRLVDSGVDTNALYTQSGHSRTPLMAAAASGSEAMLRLLLSRGADVNAANADGESALMAAIDSRNAAAVRLLLRHGAEVRTRTRYLEGRLPL